MHANDSTDDRTDTVTTASADDTELTVIGHRGCADQYPENTVLAVRQSAPHVDMIEIDVQRCLSGELVVFHDDKLDRLTDASGAVSTTEWETLRELRILDSDETIPLLADVLSAIPTDTAVNVELKHEGMADAVLDAVSAVDNDVLLSSFSVTALRELRARDDEIPLALIIHDEPDRNRAIATDLDCVAVNPGYEMVLGTDFVENAHADGLAVNAWTIADAETATRVIATGVDGVFVDRWDIV